LPVRQAVELVISGDLDAAPRARAFVTLSLDGQDPDLVDNARLVVTELVTNATLHGLPPVVVRVELEELGCRIEVEDARKSLPLMPLHSTDAMTGRGLRLIAAVSAGWGVEPFAGGKRIWARLQHDHTLAQAAPDIDVEALLAEWKHDEPDEAMYTVRLGAVPTDLLLEAKAHIDNVVREVTLASGAPSASIPHEIAELIGAVTRDFASARADIKRQALEASSRGDVETELVLTQPVSAADAGERYLKALDIVDQFAREARMLTLEAPPVHKVFRRWYVQALVDQLRLESAGAAAEPPRTFVQVLAGEMAEVARLRDAADRLALLQDIAAELTGAVTVEEIAAVVIDKASEFLGALTGRVMLVDGDVLRSVATHGGLASAVALYEEVPLAADLPGSVVVRQRESLLFRGLNQLVDRFPVLAGVYDTDRTLHVAPLIIGDHVLGVLTLSFAVGGRLDPDAQADFVQALADALAQAVERAQALQSAEIARERLAYLAEASVVLSASLDFDATAAAVGALLVPRLADWAAVQVLEGTALVTVALQHFDPDKLLWGQAAAGEYPTDMSSPTGAANVIRTGETELYPTLPAELIEASAKSPQHLELLRQFGMSSALVVPLTGRRGTFGAITLIHAESGRHYSDEDVPFALDVARRAALALETAQVLRDQSGRLADVTRVAEAAQHAILAPPPEQIGPVALAARYVSAAAEALIGGDLYEVVARPGAVRLLIGDVRGKGLAAVRTATIVLGEFRSAAADLDDLAGVARQLDRRLHSYVTSEEFVTALLAEVRDDGSYTLCVCGHPPVMLASRGTVVPISALPSVPLGLGADPTATTGQLHPGDRLLMMTDGLLEARRPDRQFVDVSEIVHPLAAGGHLGTALDNVLASLRAAIGGELGDDLALLAAEYVGPSPTS
jgi:serine phosphatase RsbU (regulator of sigma subunit)